MCPASEKRLLFDTQAWREYVQLSEEKQAREAAIDRFVRRASVVNQCVGATLIGVFLIMAASSIAQQQQEHLPDHTAPRQAADEPFDVWTLDLPEEWATDEALELSGPLSFDT